MSARLEQEVEPELKSHAVAVERAAIPMVPEEAAVARYLDAEVRQGLPHQARLEHGADGRIEALVEDRRETITVQMRRELDCGADAEHEGKSLRERERATRGERDRHAGKMDV